MNIRITTKPARIGIRTQPARVIIRTRRPEVKINRTDAKVIIKSEKPQLEIDQYECFAAIGYKNSLDLTIESARLARVQVMEFIEETARDGDRLAAIELEGNPIADIAERKAWRQPKPNVGVFPAPQPKFEARGSLEIEVKPGRLYFKVKTYPVNISVIPHKVEVYLKQKNGIKIEYIGNHVNRRI